MTNGVAATGWRAEFRLLGAVEVLRDGRVLDPLAAQPRCVLAMLLVGDGDVVSVDRLIDAVWGERPPDEPRNAIQVYVSRLRRLLAGADGVRISTEGRHGYRMAVPPGSVDLHRFRQLVAQARKHGSASDHERAAELLTSALSLWRGDPFGGAAGDWLHRQLTPGLDEEHLVARELRAYAFGRLGRHGEAIAELSSLLAGHPTREQLAAALMTALHRTGRTAEALAVFRDLRARLVEELGIEPGDPVRQLHESILAGEGGDTGEEDEDAAGPVVPAQLPAGVAPFVGRDDLVEAVSAHLSGPSGDAPRLVLVAGASGTGKSTVAVHIGHKVRAEFPDGQLYATLTGPSGRAAEPADVLGDFLVALGVPAPRIPSTVEQRAALYRSLVAERRLLVLLDGARDAGQVRQLLPGSASCAVLVTSRSRLAALPATHRMEVAGLSEAESIALLSSLLGAQRVAAEPAEAARLASCCGYLPLALRICAGRLINRPQWRLGALADRLSDERARLDELHLDDLDVRASFTLSYQQLEPDAARAFRLWSLAECDALADSAAAAMLGVDRRQADALADALIDLHLVELLGDDRLRLHDLLRQLGRELAESADPGPLRDDAVGRLVGWYAHTFASAISAAAPGVRRARYLLSGAEAALVFSAAGPALSWLDTERSNLVEVVAGAASRSLIPPADLVWIATNFGRYAGPRGHLEAWRRLATAGVAAAQRFGDKRSEARAMIALGSVAYRSYELEAAAESLGRAAGALSGSGEPTEATAMGNLALVYESLQQRAEVVEHLSRAYDIYRQVGDVRGQASTLNNLGRQRAEVGDHDEAIKLVEQALRLAESVGAADVLATAHNNLANALRLAGRSTDADRHYRTALEVVRGANNLWIEASASAGLARLRRADGRPRAAVEHFERAVTAYRDGRFDFELALVLAELGELVGASGQAERAEACWAEARQLAARLGAVQAEQVRSTVDECSGMSV